MKDILVVGMLKEGQFPKFMSFMQSDEGIAERKKIADLTRPLERLRQTNVKSCSNRSPRYGCPACIFEQFESSVKASV